MSKGFVIYAQNTKETNYVRQAYALALSIKYSQKSVTNVTLVTNNRVPAKYKAVFDNVFKIPRGDHAKGSRYNAENRWKLYHITPYDETIVLDSDMLLLEDIEIWWKYCSNFDVKFCSKIKNHKLDTVIDTIHRRAFIENGLSSPYYALHYFKKTDRARDFYKVLEFVCKNWEWCYTAYASNFYQNWLSMDLATAIAVEILGNYEASIDSCSPLEFIHMKCAIQEWDKEFTSWLNAVSYMLNSKGEVLVGNIKQSKLFHYIDDEFLSDTILNQLEELAND